MNKGELIDLIAEKASIHKTTVSQVLDAALEAIVETVSDGEKVIIVNFGSFEPRDRNERDGRNPQSGEPMVIPAKRVVHFSVGKGFKETVALS